MKLLLVVGCPPDKAHPSVDCLLTVSLIIQQQRGSRFLVVPHAGDKTSLKLLKHGVNRMLSDSPRVVKIVYIDCSPMDSEEIEYLLRQDSNEVCVYIYDHHENPFNCFLKSAKNVSYKCTPEESTAAMASRLYYKSLSSKLWLKLLTLQHFICFHEILALDSFRVDNTPLSDLVDELTKLYHSENVFRSYLDNLFYITKHVLNFVTSLDWSFRKNMDLDIYQIAGEFLGRAISTRTFLEELVKGNDKNLFSKSDVEQYKANADYWCQLIASSSLINIHTGEKIKTRFIGAIIVRPHQNRSNVGPCWMVPQCANALRNRSKAVCLIDASRSNDTRNGDIQLRINRASSSVNCSEVGLSLASAMSPEIITLSGFPWGAFLECSETAYSCLEVHLKICRKAVELSNARPLPQPIVRLPPVPKRTSRQRKSTITGPPTNTSRASIVSSTPISRFKTRRSVLSLLSVGSDAVFEG